MPFLLSIPGVLINLARRGLTFIGSLQPFQLISLALGLLSLFLMALLTDARHDARKWKAQTVALVAARKVDRANYEAASKQAEVQNKAQVAADETKRAAISKESNDAYQAQLAALRSDFARRMRAQTHPGSASAGGVSTVSAPAGGVDGEAMSGADPGILYTAETELQLNSLIDWVQRQHAIDLNAKDKP